MAAPCVSPPGACLPPRAPRHPSPLRGEGLSGREGAGSSRSSPPPRPHVLDAKSHIIVGDEPLVSLVLDLADPERHATSASAARVFSPERLRIFEEPGKAEGADPFPEAGRCSPG